ncbi:carbonic anhydrase [Castellaniella defragrans]|jgi:carbonic anhydrase|uniref:carbonic anhydrase n=1 Tax=Castellaniella defragrans (strain DSM 12143 / CCUG 39792 / 65Phen) TaxID=1437824 RepID=W8X901_CASD6|nr:carbonic anhydrase [Castellaniella defragrans]CDM23965.1 Carbonic anhydrase [Castellaniella defragrans 65Phen]
MCDSTCCAEAAAHSRRSFLRSSLAAALAVAAGGALPGGLALARTASPPKPQNVLDPDAALARLTEGNARYVSGVTRRHDFAHERPALAAGQNPYAAVLGCADSRVVPEYAFDCARGDLFVTRVAGNFVNVDMLGSLEYSVAVLGVPLILVLGHDKCGAVAAAVKAVTESAQYPGRIPSLVSAIAPAVQKVQDGGGDLLAAATAQNVRDNVAALAERSTILGDAVRAGKLRLAGAVYRLDTGRVEFLG